MIYICAGCGGFAPMVVDSLDSGTVLVCPHCDGEIVVDLDMPETRTKRCAAEARVAELAAERPALLLCKAAVETEYEYRTGRGAALLRTADAAYAAFLAAIGRKTDA